MTRRCGRRAAVTCLLLSCAACQPRSDGMAAVYAEVTELRASKRRLQEDLARRDELVLRLQHTISSLTALGPDRLDALYRVRRIEITPLSGGRDTDGAVGDDMVRLYVKLFDGDEHPFKAAGHIDAFIYELDGAEPAVIAQAHLDAPAAREAWFGRALTYHYRIDVPWESRPPKGSRVTARVHFLDLLTGASFDASREIEIHPPRAVPSSENDPAPVAEPDPDL